LESDTVTILAAQIANAPGDFAHDSDVTNAYQIGLTWSPPTFDGGSPVIDYRIWYDNANGGTSFEVLAVNILDTSYLANTVIKGQTYIFKLQARNDYGYSSLSGEVSVLAAQLPATPNAPVTVFDADYVTISWDLPDNMGSTITAYEIIIQKLDTDYQTLPTHCEGSNQAILDARSCTIPALALNQSPFLQPWGSSIYAKVSATNSYGTSTHSNAGNGAVIVTVPDAPVAIQNNMAVTTVNKVGIMWSPGYSEGGLPVEDYRVSWDQGTGSWVVRQEGVSTEAYTAASLSMGTVYSFRVEARNAYGYSVYSAEVSVLAATVPSTPSPPTSTIAGSWVIINWNEPSPNGSPMQSYTISIRESNGSTYTVNTQYCDGTQSQIVTNRQCMIPQSSLKSAPHSLVSG
jgi:hypothetical protein